MYPPAGPARKQDSQNDECQGRTANWRPPQPDIKVSVRQLFGIDTDLEVPAYSTGSEHVPELDEDYLFNRETTLAILAGLPTTAV